MSIDIERRAASVAAEGTIIRGLAIPFGSLSEDLGGFREVFEASAVDRTLTEQIDVRALVDHDSAKIIGRVRAGTMTLRKASDGLHVAITVPDTSVGRDVLTLVSRGDVSGMSIGFRVMAGGERFERRDGQPVRIISDARIVETSIVTFPAYQATDASVARRALRAYQGQQGRSIVWLRARIAIPVA
ncbi:MAG: HK97 family phage prohead protease [Vicinamibacterales bacterium]